MVTYKLQKTIRFKLFNHKNLVESFNNNFLNQNERNLSCHCENSIYIDPEHGPILTRDLQIARNNKLRGLITEGPKYGEPSTICQDKAKLSIIDGLNELDINKLQFSKWKNVVLSRIDFQINK